MSSNTALKVIHLLPDFAAAHQYTVQLVNALRSYGVHLKTVRTKSFLKSVLEFHPDVVHIHWLHSFMQTDENDANFFSCLLQIAWLVIQLAIVRASGIKIIWTVHELEIPESHYPKLDWLCIKLISNLSAVIIAHCSSAQSKIIKFYSQALPAKVKVIPHGNFIEVTANRISRDDARRLLNIPESTFVMLFFGLIRPYKGVAELIEAHKQLQRDDVLLLIVGGSIPHHQECADYMTNVKELISGRDNVRLVAKFIADDEIQTFMNASDVVVFPYLEVMTSGALIMAMGVGKPCIASRVGCIDETIDRKGAFLYDSTDKFGLLNAITACFENREKLKEMGEHNKSLAHNMNWQHIAAKTLNVYRDSL